MSTTQKTLQIYWQHTRKYSGLFWAGTIGAAIAVVTQDILPPFIVAKAFNRLQAVYSSGGRLHFSDISGYFWLFAGSLIIGMIIWRLQAFCVWIYEVRVDRDMALRLYDFLQNQGYRFHADHFGGALVTQTNRFLSAYERLMDEFIWSIVTGVVALITSIIFLAAVSPAYAAVLLSVVILYLGIMYQRNKLQMPYNRIEAARQSDQTASLADAITNVTTIRTFATEEHEYKRFTKVVNDRYEASMDVARISVKNDVISHAMTASINIIAILSGFIAITVFHSPVGVLVLAISYTQNIVSRMWQFGRVMRNIYRALGDAAEMTEILQLTPEISDPSVPEPVRIARGTIDFKDVLFYYPENKRRAPLFKNFDLRIKPGEKVGLVGPSGGGKTTVTRLLLRFMDIQKGQILIDGQDITSITQQDLRQHIAYVPQEPLLFHRSLMENIRYGSPDAGDKEVLAASKMANAHEFISKLPDGYATLVGERGVKLSGGQRQRVAIARAMLKNAPILVLDEATSALDSESEKLIQEALWKLMEGRTSIVIAHRLSTIQKMDRIIVLEKGRVAEQGSHKELLRLKGRYATLWAHQSGGFLEE